MYAIKRAATNGNNSENANSRIKKAMAMMIAKYRKLIINLFCFSILL